MWEIFTHGKDPILKDSNGEDVALSRTWCSLKSGMRLREDRDWPGRLYGIMLKCWELEPEDRKDAPWIISNLETVVAEQHQ